jgi:hypothetical protein
MSPSLRQGAYGSAVHVSFQPLDLKIKGGIRNLGRLGASAPEPVPLAAEKGLIFFILFV